MHKSNNYCCISNDNYSLIRLGSRIFNPWYKASALVWLMVASPRSHSKLTSWFPSRSKTILSAPTTLRLPFNAPTKNIQNFLWESWQPWNSSTSRWICQFCHCLGFELTILSWEALPNRTSCSQFLSYCSRSNILWPFTPLNWIDSIKRPWALVAAALEEMLACWKITMFLASQIFQHTNLGIAS